MKITQKLIKNNFQKGRYNYIHKKTYKVSKIILHTYGGGGRSLYNWFNKPSTKASAHYAVFKDGNIEQYVKESDTAWHCGTKTTSTQPNINHISIGIEHQDDNNPSDFKRTNSLYESSAQLVASICKRYKISCNNKNIEPHRKYNPHKSCPGGLNINRIINRANQILNSQKPTPKPKPKPKPQKKPLYKIYKNNKLIGSYNNRNNAEYIWYTRNADKVLYNNKNITKQFIKIMQNLKEQINKLEKDIENIKKNYKYCKTTNENLKTKINSLESQLKEEKKYSKGLATKLKDLKNKNIKTNYSLGELTGMWANKAFSGIKNIFEK